MATRNRFSGQGDFIRDSGSQKWINVFGDVQVIQNMQRLKTKIERKILKKAIANALKPVAKIAKQKAAKKSGLLKASIKSAVTKMGSGKVFVDPKVFAIKSKETGGELKRVIVKGGAAKQGNQKIQRKILAIHGDGAKIRKPANYAHLLEFGTKRMKAHPFMRPALAEGRNSAIGEIAKEVEKALKS
jgi:HK97 gp10 family phage protein